MGFIQFVPRILLLIIPVIPVKAGIQKLTTENTKFTEEGTELSLNLLRGLRGLNLMDPSFRWDDGKASKAKLSVRSQYFIFAYIAIINI